jgi:hypothetical protein
MISIRRTLAVLGLTAAVGVALAGCSASVPQQDVASTINTKLTELGISLTGQTCPDDLPAEVGKSLRCEITVEGKVVGVIATVTSVQGDQAQFDIVPEIPLVTRQDVAAAIDDELSTRGVVTDGATACPGTLIGETGRALRCEFAAGGQPVDAVATVSSVDGNQAAFDITFEARPVAEDLLATLLAQQVEQDLQVPIDGADCGGDLQPTVGEAVTCTVTSGPESLGLVVSVIAVDDTGFIEYGYDLAV